MRNFLQDKKIVGATLCSRAGSLAEYCLNNLLKYCDKVIIVLDNPDEVTKNIVNNYAERHKEIEIIVSPFPVTGGEEDIEMLKSRFKMLQGEIRDIVFKKLREMYNNGDKTDILLFPDSDEIFSDNLPNLLEEFWASESKAIVMKAVDVFGGFDTIHREGMTGHVRIVKYYPELTSVPYRWRTNYWPLKKADKMGDDFTLIHLSLLTQESFDWKVKYWKASKDAIIRWPLWKVGKDVRTCVADEIHRVLKSDPDLTVEEFLRGGDKRMPVGVENASKALLEAVEALRGMGMKTFLAFGTCLGAMRSGELIKWDWDIDLVCLGEDLNKFDKEAIRNKGFSDIKIKKDIPKMIDAIGESKELYVRTISFVKYGVRVDVDPAYISSDGKSRIILKGRKRERFCAMHPIEWFAGQETIEYRNFKYFVPSPTDQYLESNYGPDWRTPKFGPMPWSLRGCMRKYYECK
jgi:hypothetical protein